MTQRVFWVYGLHFSGVQPELVCNLGTHVAAQSSSCEGHAHHGGLPSLLRAGVSDVQPLMGDNASLSLL